MKICTFAGVFKQNRMSDGNFNRALLPHTPYASGLKAGKAIARMKAVEIFEEWLRQECSGLTEAEVRDQVEAFRANLEKALFI